MTDQPDKDQVHDAEFEEVGDVTPGHSTSIRATVLYEEVIGEPEEGLVLQGRDITHEVYDRYAACTLDKASGLWYSDVDVVWSGIRPGALPCPQQDTPELTKKALDMWCRSDEIAPGGYKKMVAEARANYKPQQWVNPVVRLGRAIFGKK